MMWEASEKDLFAGAAPARPAGPRDVTGELTADDLDQDRTLRPRTLDEYIGQERVRENLRVLIQAARDRGEALDLSVGGDPQRDRGLFLTDLSSLYYDKASDHLLVLSDESRVVIELDRAGDPLGSLTLRGGNHGLTDDVPQAEGLAMDDRGSLYVVSEPNLFYRFSRELPAAD